MAQEDAALSHLQDCLSGRLSGPVDRNTWPLRARIEDLGGRCRKEPLSPGGRTRLARLLLLMLRPVSCRTRKVSGSLLTSKSEASHISRSKGLPGHELHDGLLLSLLGRASKIYKD